MTNDVKAMYFWLQFVLSDFSLFAMPSMS